MRRSTSNSTRSDISANSQDFLSGIPLTPALHHAFPPQSNTALGLEHPHPLLHTPPLREDELEKFDSKELALMIASVTMVTGLSAVALCITMLHWNM